LVLGLIPAGTEVGGGGLAGLAAERDHERARGVVTDPARHPADRLAAGQHGQRGLQPEQRAPAAERDAGLGREGPRQRPFARRHLTAPLVQRAPVRRVSAERLRQLPGRTGCRQHDLDRRHRHRRQQVCEQHFRVRAVVRVQVAA
jgi:hypothetical protein